MEWSHREYKPGEKEVECFPARLIGIAVGQVERHVGICLSFQLRQGIIRYILPREDGVSLYDKLPSLNFKAALLEEENHEQTNPDR